MPKEKEILEFLKESNAIEQVYGEQALTDAREAWDYAYENRKTLTVNDVLEIHFLLLQNLDPEIAGKWRDCDVYIGGHRKKFFHESVFIEGVTKTLEQMALKEKDDAFTRLVHVEFERLHPFTDGNGRTGRILYAMHRLNLGLPLHIIHVGEEQKAYYQWFR